ncbi:MAG: M60 family metallopeptidase, partial [Chthoniobacteraceae bacterium]
LMVPHPRPSIAFFLAASLIGASAVAQLPSSSPKPAWPFAARPTPSALAKPGVAPTPVSTIPTDRAALLAEVASIVAPGVPGAVCAFGPAALALVGGKEGKSALLPVVAATHWEKGRVVAFGHNGYLGELKDAETARLLVNAARWAGGDLQKPKVAVVKSAALLAHLKSSGCNADALEGDGWSGRLGAVRVLVVDAHAIGEKDVEPIAKFVREGGGLVTAATGWGWSSLHPGKSLVADFPANQLLAPSGLVFAEGTPDKTKPSGYTTGGALDLLTASAALDAVLAQSQGKATLGAAQLAQAGASLSQAMRSIPASDKLLLPRLAALRTLPAGNDFPRADKPLKATDALARLLFTQNLELLKQTTPEQIRAHPAGDVFPGAVPKTAARVKAKALSIDTSVPGWHSTGLYAAPGELIRVQVPPAAADKKLAIRIGCHSDALWHLEEWKRPPEISRRDPITQAQATAANPFGGLIYIEVPGECPLGVIAVTIDGAVEAPHFILGKTSALEWKTKLRNAPAPWAELETKKIILTVPSEKIRQLDDPEALMKFWDQVLDAEADLASIPRDRKRPERIVPDVQISAGYMHSGYPIMTWLDKSVEQSLSLAEMKQGSWGHFHELGHNHQQGTWTFDGTTEVTCNLFSLYCMETLCGKPPGQGHDAMKPDAVDKRLRTYLAMGDKFPHWKSDPFLALTMYHQLRAGFGWETYKKVFAEYRDLPKAEQPKNDDEERDQWLVRFSKAAGKNLGPFFEAWGVPTSDSARASIKDLPAWMPADWPKL